MGQVSRFFNLLFTLIESIERLTIKRNMRITVRSDPIRYRYLFTLCGVLIIDLTIGVSISLSLYFTIVTRSTVRKIVLSFVSRVYVNISYKDYDPICKCNA